MFRYVYIIYNGGKNKCTSGANRKQWSSVEPVDDSFDDKTNEILRITSYLINLFDIKLEYVFVLCI